MARVKVMVVDDQKSIRGVIKLILTEIGADVVAEAGDGEQAIKLYKQHSPHLVLMDINMPKLDGVEALREIMKINKSAAVVMLTSQNTMDVVKECLELGAQNFLLKNTPPDELAKMIKASWSDYVGASLESAC